MSTRLSWLAEELYDQIYSLCSQELVDEASKSFPKGLESDIFVEKGRISSRIQLEEKKSVRVVLFVPLFLEDEWDKLLREISRNFYVVSQLINGKCNEKIKAISNTVNISLIPDFSLIKVEIDDVEAEFKDYKVIGIIEKFITQVLQEPMTLFLLRGKSREELVELLRKHISDLSSTEDTLEMQPKEENTEQNLVFLDKGKFFNFGLSSKDIFVRADELPGVILRRIDPLSQDAKDSMIDDALESLYERVARLSQSLARFF